MLTRSNPMMAPAAQSASAPAKGKFDVQSLFAADKAARDEAGVAFATFVKANGVEAPAQVGFVDAALKVRLIWWLKI